MRLMIKNDKFLTNFTAWIKKRSVFTMKATYQWTLHRLVIKAVLFLCASSVANDLQMQQWLQQN
jgi:hypothetical protein